MDMGKALLQKKDSKWEREMKQLLNRQRKKLKIATDKEFCKQHLGKYQVLHYRPSPCPALKGYDELVSFVEQEMIDYIRRDWPDLANDVPKGRTKTA